MLVWIPRWFDFWGVFHSRSPTAVSYSTLFLHLLLLACIVFHFPTFASFWDPCPPLSPSRSSPSYLPILRYPSVPSYEIKYGSIFHSSKYIYHRLCTALHPYLWTFPQCTSLIYDSHGPIWKHLNTGEFFFLVGESSEESSSRGSKNPFREFSCHNNSSAILK